jgi:hypothetical protein
LKLVLAFLFGVAVTGGAEYSIVKLGELSCAAMYHAPRCTSVFLFVPGM